MVKGLRKLIARLTYTRADTLCPSSAPAANAPNCRRGGVYSGRGRERGERAKSRRREDERLGQRVQLRHHDGWWPLVPSVTRETPAAKPRTGAAGVRKATLRHHRSPSGGPISVASTAVVVAAAAAMTAAAVTVATATTAGMFPRSRGEYSAIWRFLLRFSHCKPDAWGPSRGARP